VGKGDGDVGRAFRGVVGEETRSFNCDIMLRQAKVGKRRYGGENSVNSVAASIGEGGFGVLPAREEVVTIGVKGGVPQEEGLLWRWAGMAGRRSLRLRRIWKRSFLSLLSVILRGRLWSGMLVKGLRSEGSRAMVTAAGACVKV
jgi:hypothetical protein